MQTVAVGVAPSSRSVVPEMPDRPARPPADGFGSVFDDQAVQRPAKRLADRSDPAVEPVAHGSAEAASQPGALAGAQTMPLAPAPGPAPDDRPQTEAGADGEVSVPAGLQPGAQVASGNGAEDVMTDVPGTGVSGWAAAWFGIAAEGAMPAVPTGDPAAGSAPVPAADTAVPGLPAFGQTAGPTAQVLAPGSATAAADVADLSEPAAVQTAAPTASLSQTLAALFPGGSRLWQDALLGSPAADPAAPTEGRGRDGAALPDDLPLSDARLSLPSVADRANRMGVPMPALSFAMAGAAAGEPSASPLVDLVLAASGLADSPVVGPAPLGLSLAGPGLLTGTGPAAVLAQVAQPLVQALIHQTAGTTEIVLSPAELGQVRLTLQTDAQNPDRVVVQMTFDRPETLDLFRRNGDLLAAALREAGYAGADLSFGQSDAGSGRGPGAEHRAQGGRDGKGFAVLDQGAPAPGPARAAPLHPGTAGLDLRL